MFCGATPACFLPQLHFSKPRPQAGSVGKLWPMMNGVTTISESRLSAVQAGPAISWVYVSGRMFLCSERYAEVPREGEPANARPSARSRTASALVPYQEDIRKGQ
jgi:hypothetical protein